MQEFAKRRITQFGLDHPHDSSENLVRALSVVILQYQKTEEKKQGTQVDRLPNITLDNIPKAYAEKTNNHKQRKELMERSFDYSEKRDLYTEYFYHYCLYLLPLETKIQKEKSKLRLVLPS